MNAARPSMIPIRVRLLMQVLVWGCLAWGVGGQTVPAAEPGAGPVSGGTLRLAFATDWRSLDSAIAFDLASIPLQRLLYETLLDFDEGNRVVPSAAREWSVSEDRTRYRFVLRSDLRFAHGRPVEAADYVHGLERILNPETGSPGLGYFQGIAGAAEFGAKKTNRVRGLRAVTPGVLEIELVQPDFTFPYRLTLTFAAAVPRELTGRPGGEFSRKPVGSGPYVIREWVRNVRYRIERNPGFRGEQRGYVDRVEVMIGGDQSVHALMVETGELDLLPDVPLPDILRLRRRVGSPNPLHDVPMAATDYLFMNTEVKPFDDVRVRRAVAHALDTRRLARLTKPGSLPARGVVPPTMEGFGHDSVRYGYDPEEARRLLREAGYPDGFTTTLWYGAATGYWGRLAAGIAEDLGRVGIRLELQGALTAAFEVAVRSRGRVACGYWGWSQDYPDPGNFLEVLLSGSAIKEADGNNLSFYNSPEFNRAIDRANGSADVEQRTRSFREAEAVAMKDVPWVPTVHPVYSVLTHSRVRGFRPHPVWLVRYQELWLDPGQPAKRR